MTKKAKSKKTRSASTPSQPALRKKSGEGSSIATRPWALYSLLGISILCFFITRFKLLAIPLERDEGSFAYIGHWLFRGKELYTDMLDSKLPGLYTYYAFFTTLFGYNASGVHMGLLVANIVSGLCFYLLLKEIFNRYIAVIATCFFLWMMVSPNVLGFAAHATQLLLPFVLGGFLLFWKGVQKNKIYLFFIAGLLIGAAFTIKQQSAVFGILAALIWWPVRLWWNKKENSGLPVLEWIMLGLGGLLPAASVLIYFKLTGHFDLFYDWTVTQPMNLAGAMADPWYKMLARILPKVIQGYEGVWIAAGLGLVLVFFSGHKKFGLTFSISFGVISLLSVIIGAAYYKHYFTVAMPGLALLAACTIYWISQKAGKIGPALGIGITALLIIIAINGRGDYYFNPDYSKIHFDNYARNMFPEIEKIGKELKKRMPEGSSIGVMGSEPEVLVAADRASCTKYLMVYAILFDPVRSPPMQQDYIRELQECAPEYLVWNTTTGSWSPGYDGLAFFEQLMQWVEANYEMMALAESRDAAPGVVLWDQDVNNFQPQNNFLVYVFRKKQTASLPQK
ncbi:MAG TPA: glycosyltransferase family 39 protein [Saprospiraceae bacterium]|nr:glycosyltransferase family 39 protein [Saprospiraceae bacterium]